jgi:hypothetical protein
MRRSRGEECDICRLTASHKHDEYDRGWCRLWERISEATSQQAGNASDATQACRAYLCLNRQFVVSKRENGYG